MSILAFRWLPLPSAPEDAEKVALRRHRLRVCTIRRARSLAFSDYASLKVRSPIGARFISYFGSHRARIGRSWICGVSQALWLEVGLTGDYLTGKLGRGHLVCYGALLAAAGLSFVLLFGNAVARWWEFTCAGAGLATIIPNTFAAAGNIEGSAPGPSLA